MSKSEHSSQITKSVVIGCDRNQIRPHKALLGKGLKQAYFKNRRIGDFGVWGTERDATSIYYFVNTNKCVGVSDYPII